MYEAKRYQELEERFVTSVRAYQDNTTEERRQEEGKLRQVKVRAEDDLRTAEADQSVVRDYVGYVKARYTEILEETDKAHDLQIAEIQNKQNSEHEHTIKLYNETRGEKVILQRRNKELAEQMMRYQDELSEVKMVQQGTNGRWVVGWVA